jgi:hypothetical protein
MFYVERVCHDSVGETNAVRVVDKSSTIRWLLGTSMGLVIQSGGSFLIGVFGV